MTLLARPATCDTADGDGLTERVAMTDVIELIRADHRRILRLASVLDSTGRSSGEVGPDTALASVWDWLSGLIEVHTAAEEEICGLTFRSLGLACGPDHEDIRAALQEAGVQHPGTDEWWRAVSAAITLCTGHFSREEREILPALRDGADLSARRALAIQWRKYVLAWMRDGGRLQRAGGLPAAGCKAEAGKALLGASAPGRSVV